MAKVKKKVMKKNLFVAAAMMVAMTACVKEADVNVDVEENVPQTEEKVWVEFSTDAVTKAALQEGVGEHQIVWEEDDEISINGYTFQVTEIKEEGLKATIGAFVPADFSAPYSAVYPASAGTSFDELIVNGTPAVVAGGFDDIVSVAYSDDTSLQFKHVTSLFKFQVPAEFAVNTVTISADEALAGKVSVEMADEEATPAITVKNAVKEVTLTGTFTPGQNYYVAVLPGTKTNLTVRLNGYLSKTWANQVNVTTGMVANMKTLPAPVKSAWAIVGGKADFGSWSHDASEYFFFNEEGDRVAAKNVPFASSDEFKVVDGNNNWYALSSVVYNSWEQVTTSGSNMKLSENTYDLYLNTGTKYLYITVAGSEAPKVVPVEENHIYLSPSANWLEANAHFMAWVWKDGSEGKVYNFKEVQNATGLYEITVPAGSNRMILFRVDPAKNFTDGSTTWPGDDHWYKTDNLTINGNLYTVVNWHAEGSGFSTVNSLL